MTLPKKVNPMKTTVGSLEGVVPWENRNVTFLMVTIMLPDSFGSLCFVLFVQNLCGKCELKLLQTIFKTVETFMFIITD